MRTEREYQALDRHRNDRPSHFMNTCQVLLCQVPLGVLATADTVLALIKPIPWRGTGVWKPSRGRKSASIFGGRKGSEENLSRART